MTRYAHPYFRFIPLLLFLFAAAGYLLRLESCGFGFACAAALLLTGALTAALWPLRSMKLRSFLIVSAIATLSMLLRVLYFEVTTSDYTNFLLPWTERLRLLGGFRGLGQEIGNYNVPYMVLLALFSYLKTPVLYLIKLTSVLFDILLAAAAGLLVYHASGSRAKQAAAFAVTFCLPTVFINSAVWGQCDSIYVSLSLLALWLCLSDRPKAGMVSLGFAFAFKLQAIFLIPIFLPVLLAGKLKWRHLPLFPAAYLLAVSPALFAGRNAADVLLFYIRSATSAGSGLNYNSPSIYSLYYFYYNVTDQELAAKAGILAAAIGCLLVMLLFFRYRRNITERSLLYGALLLCCLLPMLLPHMHDRYFYFVDILTVVFSCLLPFCFPTVCCSQFASLLGYYAYFFMRYLLPMRLGFLVLVVTVAAVIAALLAELMQSSGTPQSEA